MATYNSVNYASAIGLPSTGVGLASTDARLGVMFQDANVEGAKKNVKIVQFNTTAQPLNIADIINLTVLPTNVRVAQILLVNDVATASATVQVGSVVNGTTTAGYYSTAGISIASANTKSDAYTNLANFVSETQAPTTVQALIAGANLTAATTLTFIIEYVSN